MGGLFETPIAGDATKSDYAGRNTNPGKQWESTLEHALRSSGYYVRRQHCLGHREDTTKQYADFVITKNDRTMIVSAKWQQSQGTGQDKIPGEAMWLAEAMVRHPHIAEAYIVLGGDGWRVPRVQWWIQGGLRRWIKGTERVHCIKTSDFLAKVWRGDL